MVSIDLDRHFEFCTDSEFEVRAFCGSAHHQLYLFRYVDYAPRSELCKGICLDCNRVLRLRSDGTDVTTNISESIDFSSSVLWGVVVQGPSQRPSRPCHQSHHPIPAIVVVVPRAVRLPIFSFDFSPTITSVYNCVLIFVSISRLGICRSDTCRFQSLLIQPCRHCPSN